jgi:hypothetical protein
MGPISTGGVPDDAVGAPVAVPQMLDAEARKRTRVSRAQPRRGPARLREKVAAIQELNLDSKLRAAALPGPGAVDKLTRYETSNDRSGAGPHPQTARADAGAPGREWRHAARELKLVDP